jgi:hypothetical protein
MYGAFTALSTVYIILFVPETKGKTSEEMRQHFMRKGK